MWCAVHVKDGDEIRTESFVEAFLPKELDARCIHLTRSRRKKYGGQWQTVQEKLLPGYVFIATDQPEAVHRELKKAPKPRLLFSDDSYVAILEAHEAALIEALTDENGEIPISKVRVADDGSIEFLSGPLLQVEDMVRKVNLHRREAELEAEFLGARQMLYLGIEIEQDQEQAGTKVNVAESRWNQEQMETKVNRAESKQNREQIEPHSR